MTEEVAIQEPVVQAPSQGGDGPIRPNKKLYDYLNSTKVYTKSYDDFNKQFSTPESIGKLHDYLGKTQIYTKSKEDFEKQYFTDQTQPEPVKPFNFTDFNKILVQPQQNLQPYIEPQKKEVSIEEKAKSGKLNQSELIDFYNRPGKNQEKVKTAVSELNNDFDKYSGDAVKGLLQKDLLYQRDKERGMSLGVDNTFFNKAVPLDIRKKEADAIKNQITPEAVDEYKNDPTKRDVILGETVNQLRKQGKEQQANNIEANKFLFDYNEYNAGNPKVDKRVEEINDKIRKGEYGYVKGRVVKYEGALESMKTGFENRNKSYDLGYQFLFGSPEENIKTLNEEIKNQNDPLKPVPVPKGFGSDLGHFVGSEGISTLKGVAPHVLDVVAPGAGQAVSMALTAEEMGIRGYADKITSTYAEMLPVLKEKHPDWTKDQVEKEAYRIANESAKTSGATDAIVGAILAKGGGKSLSKVERQWSQEAIQAGKTIPKETMSVLKKATKGLGDFIGGTIKTGVVPVGASGAGQILKNLRDQGLGIDRRWDEGVAESMKGMLLLHTMFHTAAKLGGLAAKEGKALYEHLAKLPETDIMKMGNNLVHDRILSRHEADQVVQDVINYKLKLLQVPPHIKDEKTISKLTDKIDEHAALTQQLKGGENGEGKLSDGFKKPIQDKLHNIEQDMDILQQHPERQVKILEDIKSNLETKLSKISEDAKEGKAANDPTEKLKMQDRLKEINSSLKDANEKLNDPVFKATEVLRNNIDKVDGIYKEVAKSDPEGFLQEIAEQAQNIAPTGEEHQGTESPYDSMIKSYPKELVDAAIEAYPAKEPVSEVPSLPETQTPEGVPDEAASSVYDDLRKQIIEIIPKVKTTAFDWRITIPEMTQAEREGAISDIKAGKNTKRAQKLEAAIKKMYENGEVELNRGRGNHTEKTGIPIRDWLGLDNNEQAAVDKIDDHIANIIMEDGVTLENIESLKHLFDGFPYDKEDFSKVKEYLSKQSEGNAEIKGTSESGEGKPPVEKPRHTISTPVIRNVKLKEATSEVGEVPPVEEPPIAASEGEGEENRRLSGISERVQRQLGIKPYEKGEGWSPKEAFAFGQAAIAHGVDPNKVAADPNYANLSFGERLAVAQAHHADLVGDMNKMGDNFGTDSNEFKEAAQKVADYQSAIQHLKTESSKAFTAQQGEYDVDTNSFTAVSSKIKENTGQPLSESQSAHVKDLTDKNKQLQAQLDETESRLKAETDKQFSDKSSTNAPKGKLSIQLKNAASKLRATDEFDKFLKGWQGDKPAQMGGIDLGSYKEILANIYEGAAKIIEKGEDAIEFIKKAIDNIKEDIDKEKMLEDIRLVASKAGVDLEKQTPEQKNIIRLEKELEDLQNNIAKQKNPKRELSDKEKELKEQIRDEKERLGLVASKAEKPLTEKEIQEQYEEKVKNLQTLFVNKKDNKFTPEESKNIWNYGKETYLDKGVNFRDMISRVSDDLGLTFEQVSNSIVTPKTKRVSDAMWKHQYDLQKNRQTTQRYIDSQGQNAAVRAFKKVSNLFREVTVFGHGGVFIGTHAGMTLMDVPRAKYTLKAFFNANKFAYGKEAPYAIAMEGLKKRSNYELANRAGLRNNPDIINNDAEIIAPVLGRFSESGKRGFNAIKILRQDLFDSHYNSLSAAEKADPKAAESIAKLVNNATGASNLNIPDWVNEVTFAGGMEASRWGKVTRNPMKATSTAIKSLFNPDKVSIEDKVFAKVWAKRVGTELATYTGLLVANAALQNLATDDKDKQVNLTDPTQADWLKMKIGNTTFDFTSGMLSTLHFIEQLAYQSAFDEVKSKRQNELESASKTIVKYGIGKLSPFYGDVAEVALRHDYMGNTLPFSDAKPFSKKYNHKLTWAEYAASKLPLPIAEGFKSFYESAHENGMSKDKIDHILTGLQYGAISGLTGFKGYESKSSEGGSGGGSSATGTNGRTPRTKETKEKRTPRTQ